MHISFWNNCQIDHHRLCHVTRPVLERWGWRKKGTRNLKPSGPPGIRGTGPLPGARIKTPHDWPADFYWWRIYHPVQDTPFSSNDSPRTSHPHFKNETCLFETLLLQTPQKRQGHHRLLRIIDSFLFSHFFGKLKLILVGISHLPPGRLIIEICGGPVHAPHLNKYSDLINYPYRISCHINHQYSIIYVLFTYSTWECTLFI